MSVHKKKKAHTKRVCVYVCMYVCMYVWQLVAIKNTMNLGTDSWLQSFVF